MLFCLSGHAGAADGIRGHGLLDVGPERRDAQEDQQDHCDDDVSFVLVHALSCSRLATAALAAACRAWGGEKAIRHIADVKEYALERLRAQVEGLRVISAGDAPHICAVSLPGYPSEMLVRELSDRGICVSSGSACHRGKPSHVFAATGRPKRELMGTLRVSFCPDSTREEAKVLTEALTEIKNTRIAAG